MENESVIITKRLVLRPFEMGDAQALFSLLRDREVNRFLPWFPLNTLEEAKQYLCDRLVGRVSPASGFSYAVCLKPEDAPIGYVNVSGEESRDLGYALVKEHWGQGIVTEACRAVIEKMKAEGLPFLTATHDVQNPASGRVMQKLGMTYQYSYEELWQPKNKLVTFRMYQLNLDGQTGRVYRKYWEQYPVHFVEPGINEGGKE